MSMANDFPRNDFHARNAIAITSYFSLFKYPILLQWFPASSSQFFLSVYFVRSCSLVFFTQELRHAICGKRLYIYIYSCVDCVISYWWRHFLCSSSSRPHLPGPRVTVTQAFNLTTVRFDWWNARLFESDSRVQMKTTGLKLIAGDLSFIINGDKHLCRITSLFLMTRTQTTKTTALTDIFSRLSNTHF